MKLARPALAALALAAGAVLAPAVAASAASHEATIAVSPDPVALGANLTVSGSCPDPAELAVVELLNENGDAFNGVIFELGGDGSFSGTIAVESDPEVGAPAPQPGDIAAAVVYCLAYGSDEPIAEAGVEFGIASAPAVVPVNAPAQEELADTGSDAGALGLTGGAAIAAGAGLVWVARRRLV
jgi:LPXTG-motif cell wall-anchored protein